MHEMISIYLNKLNWSDLVALLHAALIELLRFNHPPYSFPGALVAPKMRYLNHWQYLLDGRLVKERCMSHSIDSRPHTKEHWPFGARQCHFIEIRAYFVRRHVIERRVAATLGEIEPADGSCGNIRMLVVARDKGCKPQLCRLLRGRVWFDDGIR